MINLRDVLDTDRLAQSGFLFDQSMVSEVERSLTLIHTPEPEDDTLASLSGVKPSQITESIFI